MRRGFTFCLRETGFLSLLSLVLLVLLSSSCSRKYIKPRSEVLGEAKSSGLPVRTAVEDAHLFLRREKLHENRLMTLLRRRTEPSQRDRSYRIGPEDEIEINVFDVPELNITSKVRQSGFISLPLIGALQVATLTEDDVEAALTTRLRDYVRSPQVTVMVTSYGSQNVAVMGAVEKPGTVSLTKGSNSIVEVVSKAGGMTPQAGNFLTFIPSEVSGVNAASTAEARAKLSLATHEARELTSSGIEIPIDLIFGTSGGIPLDVPVRGGDMVIIAEAGTVMVDGEVDKPGSYNLGKRMSLLGALAASGGITYSAKVDEVEVLRDVGEADKARLLINLEEIGLGGGKDIRLRDGDIVVVPTHSGRRIAQSTFEGLAKLINFGVGGTYNVN